MSEIHLPNDTEEAALEMQQLILPLKDTQCSGTFHNKFKACIPLKVSLIRH